MVGIHDNENNMNLTDRIELLSNLGDHLKTKPDSFELAKLKASKENPWFSPENIDLAVSAIVENYLNGEKLRSFCDGYDIGPFEKLRVSIVSAGNIPLVGMHDLLMGFLAGVKTEIKLSAKDKHLIPVMVDFLHKKEPAVKEWLQVIGQVKNPGAVIATGSDNTSRYFESYFRHIPRLIRKNRNSVAVISGEESRSDLEKLADDVFVHFGLGCRNVSFLYVPKGYDFTEMIEVFKEKYGELADHSKFRNNYEYNLACSILNKEVLIQSEVLLFYEKDDYLSRIATLNYKHYNKLDDVWADVQIRSDQIQCVVSGNLKPPETIEITPFGKTQSPQLSDFADGKDSMDFLLNQKTSQR